MWVLEDKVELIGVYGYRVVEILIIQWYNYRIRED